MKPSVKAEKGEAKPAVAAKEDVLTASWRQKRGRDPLLSSICHDLRAPLAAVTMGANFVLQTERALREDPGGDAALVLADGAPHPQLRRPVGDRG
jgi:K+-sensing histidine kinase KdpD